MSVPKPKQALTGHCAAIDDNTLYVFNNDVFQSLHIKKNAKWSKRTAGVTVRDPACVKAVSSSDGTGAALYVLGGDTDNGAYFGLQRYIFGDDSWETLSPLADVLRSRTNHSVAYLADSQSILIYGGSTPDAPSLLSSQTFLLSTQAPYNIESFTSQAPPANNPILQPWNSSHAIMVGGETTNTGVWLFGPENGWTQFPTDLVEPLDPSTRGLVIDGADGSRILEIYNFQSSPNTAQGIVLLDADGKPAPTGQTVGQDTKPSNTRKRDLTINTWPSYNDTNAPTSTRADCSISRNAHGIVVMAGGNEKDPIAMYDQNDNSWIDAGQFFDRQVQQPLHPSSTASSIASSPTASVESAATSTQPASVGGNGSEHNKTMRTLGITLGVLCGIAALFILVLLFLRWRKMKAKKQNGGYLQEKEGGPNGERMSFADRGASFMKEAGVSANELAPPNRSNIYNNQQNSRTSLAIITGKVGNKRNTAYLGHTTKESFESTAHLVRDNFVPTENHEMMNIGDKNASSNDSNLLVPGAGVQGIALDKETLAQRKRSSGWSKYFATSQPTGPNGLSHLPSAYIKPDSLSLSTDSRYSGQRALSELSRIPSAQLVPPLEIDFNKTVDGQRLSHVAQGSPAFFDSREDFARAGSLDVQDGQKGVIVDPSDPRTSQATSIGSSYGNRSTIDSTTTSEYYNESHTPWTPMSTHHDRATSSVYTTSIYDAGRRVPSRGKSAGFFPGAGTNFKPPKIKLSHAASPASDWASPKAPSITEEWPMPPKMPIAAAAAAQARDSTVTIFPGADYLDEKNEAAPAKAQRSLEGAQQQSQRRSVRQSQRVSKPITNGDMSWLDLKS